MSELHDYVSAKDIGDYASTADITDMIRGKDDTLNPLAHDIWGIAREMGAVIVRNRSGNHTTPDFAERIATEYLYCWQAPFKRDGKLWYNSHHAIVYLSSRLDQEFRTDNLWKALENARVRRKRINGRYHVTHDELERYVAWVESGEVKDESEKKVPHHINYSFNNGGRSKGVNRTPEENRRIIAEMEQKAMRGEVEPIYLPHPTGGQRQRPGERGASTLDRSLMSDADIKAWL